MNDQGFEMIHLFEASKYSDHKLRILQVECLQWNKPALYIADTAFNDLIGHGAKGWLAFSEDQLVGVLSYYNWKRADYLRINNLASSGVIRGIGSLLLWKAAATASDEGKGLDLESTEDAIGFYAKLEFEWIQETYDEYGNHYTNYHVLSPEKTRELSLRGVKDYA